MTMTDDRTAEMRALVSRIERLLGPMTPEQFAALDNYGNPGTVAPAELIESSWGNATSDRVVRIFPDIAARDTWLVAPEGALCEAPVGVLWLRIDGQWKAPGRIAGGYNFIDQHIQTTGGVVLHFDVPAVDYLSRMQISGCVWLGADSGSVTGAQGGVNCADPLNNSWNSPPASTPGPNQYVPCPTQHSWVVQPNQLGTFSLSCNWSGAVGTVYSAASCVWDHWRI